MDQGKFKYEKDIAAQALEMAIKKGCKEACVEFNKKENDNFVVRDGSIDMIQNCLDTVMIFKLFDNGKSARFATNKLDIAQIERLIDNNMEVMQCLQTDKFLHLPDKELCFHSQVEDMLITDPAYSTIENETKKELAFAANLECYGKDKRILSVTSEFSCSHSFDYMIDSQGFEGEYTYTIYSLSTQCSLRGRWGARPSDYWLESGTHFNQIDFTGTGVKALQRTIEKLSPKRVRGMKCPMIIDKRVSFALLEPILDALSGSSIQQKDSFLMETLGKTIFAPHLTIMDMPLKKGFLGARQFDSEGLALYNRPIIEDGKPQLYYMNTYFAEKLGMKPTADEPSILSIKGNCESVDALIAQAEKGIYVTNLNGGNCNVTTGDFSYGAEGFLIESGKKGAFVHNMVISGNMKELWTNFVTAANDATKTDTFSSLMFSQITINGK